jgi:antitoxin HicB
VAALGEAKRSRKLVRSPAAATVWAVDTAREFEVVMVAEPEGGYSVFVPELPSVATQGETIEEARANAQEAIEGYLEVMHEDGLPIPPVHRDRVAVHAA